MSEVKHNQLISLACNFNSEFKHFLAAHDSRILPKLKSGIVQKPIDNIYWQKECGVFKSNGDNLWSLEEEDDSIFRTTCEYDDDGSYKIGISHAESANKSASVVQKQRYIPVITRPECLMYVGEWCYLKTHSDVGDKEEWYSKSIERLVDHPFEYALNKYPSYKFLLQCVKREKVSLHDSFKGSHDDAWVLKTNILRVIAGALEIYADPSRGEAELHLASQRKVLNASLGKLIKPNEQTAAAAKRLIRCIKESGAEIDWMDKLESVASKQPYPTIKITSPLKALVREISLLSKMLVNTSNNYKNRFPISAIQHILGFIDVEVSNTAIKKHQALYDESADQYLSNVNDITYLLSEGNLVGYFY